VTGRPTKLNQAIADSIVASMLEHVPLEVAAEKVGVTDASIWNWMKWGERGKGEPYNSFFDRVTRARAESEATLVARALEGDEKGASNGPARCAQWYLGVRNPKRYAQRLHVKLEEELESLLDVLDGVCSEKGCGCLEEILAALAARARGEEVGAEADGEDGPPEGEAVE
jgi:hypothetical protein